MARSDSKVIATIEVDIDTALNFLESQFSDPEVRWGGLRSLIAKQKAAEHRVHSDVCHKSPSKTHSWYGSSQGYVCEHCGTRR